MLKPRHRHGEAADDSVVVQTNVGRRQTLGRGSMSVSVLSVLGPKVLCLLVQLMYTPRTGPAGDD